MNVKAELVIKVGDREVNPRDQPAVRAAALEVAKSQLAGVPTTEQRSLLESAVAVIFEHFIALGNAIYERTQIGIIDDQLETLQQALGKSFGFVSSSETASTDGAQLPEQPQIYVPE